VRSLFSCHRALPLLPFAFPFLSGVFWLTPALSGKETVQVLLMSPRLVENALTVDLFVSREEWWPANALAV
jgi:hypothetical protein